MDVVLKTDHLSKQYGKQTAVNDLNINVKIGEIYGFLGQNGAGKTTSIRMILGLIRPTSGSVSLFGESVKSGDYRHFKKIGAIVEAPGYYPNLTAYQNLDIHRRMMNIRGRECIEKALSVAGIPDEGNKKAKDLSLGMKQRLGLARALLHEPELLILDEPTNGLDPVGIKEIRDFIRNLAQKEKITVFISSHILSEIESLADRIGVLDHGKLLEETDMGSLRDKSRQYIQIKVDNPDKAVEILKAHLYLSDYRIITSEVLRVYDTAYEAGDLNRILCGGGLLIKELSVVRDSLEDYFIHLTGGGLNG